MVLIDIGSHVNLIHSKFVDQSGIVDVKDIKLIAANKSNIKFFVVVKNLKLQKY